MKTARYEYLTLDQASKLSGASTITISHATGRGWTLPAMTTLADGRHGWNTPADIAIVLAWCDTVRGAGRRGAARTAQGAAR